MKLFFILIALVSAGLLIYSVVHLSHQLSGNGLPLLPEIKGFEDTNPNDPYNQLLTKFSANIRASQAAAEGYRTRYFWLSFLVTALTAGSTLISSIQAATTEASDKIRIRRFAILVAILTFCSTLSNFTSTHYNDLKTEEEKKATDMATRRTQFYADYNKAAPADKPGVIDDYAHRLEP